MIKLNNRVVDFASFPNGETNLNHSDLLIHSYNEILFKYENDNDLIELMFLKKYLDSNKAVTGLVIAYMPYSRMDRSENNSPFTLKYVSEFINSLNFDTVTLIEPHSDVSVALINNSEAMYINFDLLQRVMETVDFNSDQDYIMFPDSGAAKRYCKMKFKNLIVGNKERDFETGEIKGLTLHSSFEGSGKKVIIVDDLSSYGGTFIRSAESLREQGFEEIYLLVAHAENSIFKGKLFENIDKIFTTNSILTEQGYWGNLKYEKQLKIYEIEEVL